MAAFLGLPAAIRRLCKTLIVGLCFIAARADKILAGRFAVEGDLLLAAVWF